MFEFVCGYVVFFVDYVDFGEFGILCLGVKCDVVLIVVCIVGVE